FYGAKSVLAQQLSPGFFLLFVASLFSLISPLKTVGTAYASLKQASAALPRITRLLEEKEQTPDTGQRIFDGEFEKIEFQHLSFTYGGDEVLKDICLELRKGESLGIVGPTGTGKTTLVALLLRLYQPASGKILIDGQDISEFSLNSLRRQIALVTQEPILFSDTIAWNVSLAEKPDWERLEKVAAAVGISEFIESLPARYETIIGERGTTLSGGQKQLLTIARALYRDPPILILDEATASLDSQSEDIIQKALEKIMAGRTVLVIAHRLSTLRHVRKIVVLKDGRIRETGSHQELFEKKGIYYQLWTLQFQG
ncbi:MAG: ABC transporter ATP-binding protein/permease, partial [Candidatus Omnitrophica bacterium]|nr:ABC transporter ATP-binding protein/permease [Candidatus Omnitrophota bacterium]